MRDPTARADEVAEKVRLWYEANRETWWERRRARYRYTSDSFILGLVQAVNHAQRSTAR
jgi:hypothetical protein